ncbi:hypothetical protein DDQ68_18540 [Hymenobacter nivis]|uniref:Uncharacterized protein n=1 Tax=Hymenobacter nivis TaxID=1850093 RepID=A0A2Z3GLJ3_9BACT|nr:hypothetical protein DDQ68_18540 [Hymenobacter nivis]
MACDTATMRACWGPVKLPPPQSCWSWAPTAFAGALLVLASMACTSTINWAGSDESLPRTVPVGGMAAALAAGTVWAAAGRPLPHTPAANAATTKRYLIAIAI